MRCPACGHANRPGARFCGGCGASLPDTVDCPGCGTSNPAGQRFCDACGHELERAEQPTEEPVAFADGRYHDLRILGEGARKRVYRAHDGRLNRDVALAVVKTDGLDETGRGRVRREIEALGRLGDHPNIVTVHDVGEERAALYIVSEYMPGGDLRRALRATPDHRLAIGDALRIGIDVARALGYAHEHQVIHRDLKPENIWLTARGTAKLGDFGLAVPLDRSPLTAEGTMVGTVAYIAPEQALGRPVDARSDLYALGAVLYELLCGHPPFVGEDAVTLISQHVHTAPVAPSWHRRDVPAPLEALVLHLLAKAPDDRPADANHVRERLERISALAAGVEPAPPHPPAALNRLGGGAFVGRDAEIRQLRSALDDALGGHGRLFMLAGEPGIGKTRLAAELATYATLRGAQVLWGRCWEGEGAPAYWPWVQVIRAHVQEAEPAALTAEMGAGAADIAQIVSEVRDVLPGLAEPPPLEPEQARFRLFDSVATFLRNAAARQPLAIVLDDLHWADKPSLLLLQFIAREARDARILVIGTYRDVELDRRHPLTAVLADLRRERGHERLALRGLTRDETQLMLEGAAQHHLESVDEQTLVEAVYRETEGNPYFIGEVIRHLVESGAIAYEDGRWVSDARRVQEIGIPEGVRDVIGRRLSRLSEEANRLLTEAAVIGREFRFETLAALGDVPKPQLLEHIAEAIEAGVVQEAHGEFGLYSFTHALIRETLYDELATGERITLHRRIGEVLEHSAAGAVERHLPELAHHFLESARAGDARKAIDYARRTARRAIEQYAFEEAAASYERALGVLDVEPGEPEERLELLMALGDAQWRAGDIQLCKATFRGAADLARELGRSAELARAALGYGAGLGGFGVTDRADPVLLGLLREALDALAPADSGLRARVLARLAVELYYTDEVDERSRLSREAVEMAERLGDPTVRLVALYSRHWSMLGPDGDLEEQMAAAHEIVRLAEEVGEREMAFEGRHFRLNALLQLGDITAVDAEIRACSRVAHELRQPLYLWRSAVFTATRALQQGCFDEGERLAIEAWRIGRGSRQEITFVVFGTQIFIARFGQGRLEEVTDGAVALAERYPDSAWPAALAFMYAELDRRDEARAVLDSQARDGFRGLRRDGNWLAALPCLSVAVTYLDDKPAAAALYDLLVPHADVFPTFLAGAGIQPPNDAPMAWLAGTLERWDVATRHFERALERLQARGIGCFIPLVQREYARMLLAQGGEPQRKQALALLAQGLDVARAQGMKRMVEQLLELKLRAQGVDLGGIDVRSSIDAVARSVDVLRPDLRPAASPEGTVTVMFSDIEGSTPLNERLGDKRFLEVLMDHHRILRRELRAHNGVEVRSEGDGFMIAFASPVDALRCAADVQHAFAAYSQEHPEHPLRLRIGLHTGEMLREKDALFGRNVVFAAGIGDLARGGEVLVSDALRRAAARDEGLAFDEGREVELRGLVGSHRVYSLMWQRQPAPVRGSR